MTLSGYQYLIYYTNLIFEETEISGSCPCSHIYKIEQRLENYFSDCKAFALKL